LVAAGVPRSLPQFHCPDQDSAAIIVDLALAPTLLAAGLVDSTTTLPRLPQPAVATGPVTAAAADPREVRATHDLYRFSIIIVQLALILLVFRELRLEERAFLRLAALAFAGFAVHYWLPFRWKEPFWLALSVGGAFVLMNPVPAALVLGLGLVIFGIMASPLAYRIRLGLVVAFIAVLMYGRATLGFGFPYQFWPVFGAIFAFRLIIYLYDARHFKERPALRDFARYFFILPNYYFLLFPVIDFNTMRRSYFQRDIHVVAQQGVDWIVRGAIQLLLYRLIYHLKGPSSAPDEITTFGALLTSMVMTYLLYLRVSGQFHIIIGLLHLFGYDLPETHRRYLLASSLTDFWRRINIYWKDFMVKIVYFPVYFQLRRSGETRAQIVATAAVFFCTWVLHSYQWFWLRGEFLFTATDTLFWGILGVLVIVNLLVEQRGRATAKPKGELGPIRHSLQIAGTFLLVTTLWSLWNAPTVGDWLEVMTYWRVG
jgi:alginate O-acetyltransferase complex protein AlgI